MLKTLSCLVLLSSPVFAGGLDQPVVGGTEVAPGEWPDVVLVVAPTALCSGTLVAPNVVLTAGHCIGIHPTSVLVNSVDYGVPGGDVIRVQKAVSYPDWQHTYDVGVLVLAQPASVKPRAVASACTVKEHFAVDAPVELVGFGLTTKSGTGSNTRLHEATLPVIDATCAKDPACNQSVAPNGEFVAGGMGTDSCFGDSGGPLYVETQQGAALIGVVSRGIEAGGMPCGGGGVYERADKVVSWVEQTTGAKLVRSPCDGGKADDPGTASAGGCSIGGGTLGGGALAIAAIGWILTIPRRRSKLTK